MTRALSTKNPAPPPERGAVREKLPPAAASQDRIRGFYYDPRRAALGHQYLLRKWLPREGPLFFSFISVLRSFCYADPTTGELREECYPSVETLACRCGVSARTIHRLIERDAEGHFLNRALERFVKILPRHRYDAKLGHGVQTSSLYLVALDDPPVPEDDHLVAEKEAELAVLHALSQASPAGSQDYNEDVIAEDSDCQNDTHSGLPKWQSYYSAKMADEIVPSTITLNTNTYRTIADERQKQTRNDSATEISLSALPPGTQEPSELSEPATREKGNAHRTTRVAGSKRVKSDREKALAEALAQAGGVVQTLIKEDFRGSNAAAGTRTILDALLDAGAPLEKMVALAYRGRTRLRQEQALGNPIQNPTGYYITIMRELGAEAKDLGWDIERLKREDEEKFAVAAQRQKPSVQPSGNIEQAPLFTAWHQSVAQPQETEGPEVPSEAQAGSSEGTAGLPLQQRAEEARLMTPQEGAEEVEELDGVERIDVARLARLESTVPDGEQRRSVQVLWGFVCEALQPRLSLARRHHLERLQPAVDPEDPRVLLLLSSEQSTIRFFTMTLAREIQEQVEKLLRRYFDTAQIGYVPQKGTSKLGGQWVLDGAVADGPSQGHVSAGSLRR